MTSVMIAWLERRELELFTRMTCEKARNQKDSAVVIMTLS